MATDSHDIWRCLESKETGNDPPGEPCIVIVNNRINETATATERKYNFRKHLHIRDLAEQSILKATR